LDEYKKELEQLRIAAEKRLEPSDKPLGNKENEDLVRILPKLKRQEHIEGV
jgi:hypothetical protein